MHTHARTDANHLRQLLRREQHAMADFLLALAEFDRRRRWAELGHANLWAFLHHDLGLSAGAAHWRKVAAGLVRAFPAVVAPLRDGRLCLSSVVELAKVLTPENEAAVLPRFFRLSAREARAVSVELAPPLAMPFREVITVAAPAAPATVAFRTSETAMTHPAGGEGGERREDSENAATFGPGEDSNARLRADPASAGDAAARAVGLAPEAVPQPRLQADEVTPLSTDFRRLHLTVSRRFVDKLEAAKSARAHARPAATAGAILEDALDLLLSREAKRRWGATDRPRKASRPCAPGRLPAEVRREVWTRDEGRCQWPLEGGGVCCSTYRLEFDHVQPRAQGGPSTADNVRLLCGPHNAEAARRSYGEDFMARALARATTGRRRAKTRAVGRATESGKDDGPPAGAEGPSLQLPMGRLNPLAPPRPGRRQSVAAARTPTASAARV
jgi:5-methylcytosine-specific restriction endonuclease McrA